MAIKMIKIGPRDCILANEHCIPFDMVSRIEFFPAKDGERGYNFHARIFTATVPDGIKLDDTESSQLKKLLNQI